MYTCIHISMYLLYIYNIYIYVYISVCIILIQHALPVITISP